MFVYQQALPARTLLPLTSAQSGIFHHQCQHDGNPFYNVGGYIRLDRPNLGRLRRAHARLVETYEVFKLRIVMNDAGVHQTHSVKVNTDLALVDLSAWHDPERAAQAWLDDLFSTSIALEDGELYRSTLLKLSDSLFFYVGMGHHIALDGIGFVNWGTTLARFYSDVSGAWLPGEAELSNAELVGRDGAYRNSGRYQKDRDYWARKVGYFNDGLFSRAYGDQQGHARSAREVLPVTPQLQAKLLALCETLGVERHQLVLAMLTVYFSQSYNADSVVIGTPLHGRHAEAEKAKIGLFTQMLPLLVEVEAANCVAGLLEQIQRAQRELLRHRRFPVMEVANDPHNPRAKNQLFDFAYSYLPVGQDLLFEGQPGRLVYCSHGHEQLPLLVTYWDAHGTDGSALFFDYNLGYFSGPEI